VTAYLIYKARSARSWAIVDIRNKEEAKNEVQLWGENWAGCVLYKEFSGSGAASIAGAFVASLNGLVTPTSMDNFHRSGLWGQPSGSPRATPAVITDAWVNLPWLDNIPHYAATLTSRFTVYQPSFSNGGLALRHAVSKIAELPDTLEGGYIVYPCIVYNPTRESFMPSGVATPELVSEGQVGYLSIKDCANNTYLSCANCGRVGHNKANCTYPPKEHDKVGIEIEGRFRNLTELIPIAEELTGGRGVRDSSVQSDRHNHFEPHEFQTKAGSLGSAITQLIKLFPDSSNESCGMHIHVSFPSAQTGLLYSQEFFDYFITRWKAWGTRENIHPDHYFWSRLRGEGAYCHLNTIDTRGQHPTMQDRYKQLNWAAWREHKTIECRLLPMFRRQSLAVSAAQELIDIYETYLAQDLGEKLHKENVQLPKPNFKSHREKREWDDFKPHKEVIKYECCMEDLPPVKTGMIRIAYPTGAIVPSSASKTLERITTNSRKKA
jgi:hypothetical protein